MGTERDNARLQLLQLIAGDGTDPTKVLGQDNIGFQFFDQIRVDGVKSATLRNGSLDRLVDVAAVEPG